MQVGLTIGHPVLINGEWKCPFEICSTQKLFVDFWYNFELEGGPYVPQLNYCRLCCLQIRDHSVVINGLVLATLGKECDCRFSDWWPNQNNL